VLEESPDFIKTGDCGLVTIRPTKPMCVEPYHKFAPLGRFAVRDMKKTVAVGLVQETVLAKPGKGKK